MKLISQEYTESHDFFMALLFGQPIKNIQRVLHKTSNIGLSYK